MARPQLKIEPKQVEALASIGCTTEEISTILECSSDTLERRFAAVLKKGRAHLCMSLRRQQVTLAQQGDRTMLIWLGKQLLGQRDKHEYTERKIDYAVLTDEELEALASAESIG